MITRFEWNAEIVATDTCVVRLALAPRACCFSVTSLARKAWFKRRLVVAGGSGQYASEWDVSQWRCRSATRKAVCLPQPDGNGVRAVGRLHCGVIGPGWAVVGEIPICSQFWSLEGARSVCLRCDCCHSSILDVEVTGKMFGELLFGDAAGRLWLSVKINWICCTPGYLPFELENRKLSRRTFQA